MEKERAKGPASKALGAVMAAAARLTGGRKLKAEGKTKTGKDEPSGAKDAPREADKSN